MILDWKEVIVGDSLDKEDINEFLDSDSNAGKNERLLSYPRILFHNLACITETRDKYRPMQGTDLCEVRGDIPVLHTGVVILIDEQRLDDHQDLEQVGPLQVIQLVHDVANHLHSKIC